MQATKRAAELNAQGIGKTYGDFHALSDISLTIGRGEFLTLLGPSGSGKTTFLMILAGFVSATSGVLLKDGSEITKLPAEKRAFGMVFQGYALFPHMSVEKNIAFPLQIAGKSGPEIQARVNDMVDKVGLRGHEKKRPADLSGGQQQRVALARALAFEPSVLLLDEPFSALDKNLRGSMQDEVRRLHQETGTTFVFVTHDQSEALALSTRVAIFNQGKLQQVATPRDIYERPTNRFVAEFLGDINILPLSGASAIANGAEAKCGDQVIRAAASAGTPTANLAIRPEHMCLQAEKPATGNALPVTIESVTYLGSVTRFAARSNVGPALVLETPTHAAAPGLVAGSQAWVGWKEEQGYFL
ncbi:ABC transporter ATP-binding protein [Rhizobium sp. KVB221]|uniref:ABC transporter ATP-binding protein n=1 Tax=Rhizobium setariae TaxID=2801340 RepID=A0A936YSP4_9HYPH|nr:ABC transporter ATP-binding protein [Rhizobium setariae]MBL0372196.1 ABC transporter ATP-binding protein [Rhizobium setariae]